MHSRHATPSGDANKGTEPRPLDGLPRATLLLDPINPEDHTPEHGDLAASVSIIACAGSTADSYAEEEAQNAKDLQPLTLGATERPAWAPDTPESGTTKHPKSYWRDLIDLETSFMHGGGYLMPVTTALNPLDEKGLLSDFTPTGQGLPRPEHPRPLPPSFEDSGLSPTNSGDPEGSVEQHTQSLTTDLNLTRRHNLSFHVPASSSLGSVANFVDSLPLFGYGLPRGSEVSRTLEQQLEVIYPHGYP